MTSSADSAVSAATVTRRMKARRSSRVACGCYVLRGQVIVKRGGSWRCLDCALSDIRQPTSRLAWSTQTTKDVPAQGGAEQEGTT